ncbi:signal peptidase II [bacterium]|nr:signal peptidase II [bacterium]
MIGRRRLWVMGVIIVLIDQLCKWAAATKLSLYTGLTVVPGILEFHLVYNFGAAYGIFQHQRLLLIFTTIVVFGLAWLFRRTIVTSVWSQLGLMFVISGAFGNLVDRIHLGYVVDFVNIYIIPVFNVADVCINLGVACFIIEVMNVRRLHRH